MSARYQALPTQIGERPMHPANYPFGVYDWDERRWVALLGGQPMAEDFAEQLNAKGFIEVA